MPLAVHGYRDLLVQPGVPRLLVAATFNRLTTSMLSLSLLLAVVQRDGSYAEGGLALMVHAFASALMAPVNGRVADRIGPRPTMLAYVALHAGAYCGLLLALGSGASLVVVLVSAAVVGASTPPANPVTRAQWPSIVSRDRLQMAYAVDSVLNSSMLVLGPLVAGALMLAMPAIAVIAVAGAVKIIGDLLLATAPTLRRHAVEPQPSPHTRQWLGPISDGRLRLLLLIMALDTFTYGCLQIGAAAITGGQSPAALLFSALAAGEILGGLIYGARTWVGGLRRQFMVLHLVTAVLLLLTGQVLIMAIATGFYLLIGLAGGARDVLGQWAISHTARQQQRAEAFAWLTTAMWGGYGLGTLIAGLVQADMGTGTVFWAAALASMLAACVALLLHNASINEN